MTTLTRTSCKPTCEYLAIHKPVIQGLCIKAQCRVCCIVQRLLCTTSAALLQALPNGTVIDHSFPNNAWHGHKVLQVDPANGLLHVPLGAPCNDCPLDIAFGNISYGGTQHVHCSVRCFASRQCAAVSHQHWLTVSVLGASTHAVVSGDRYQPHVDIWAWHRKPGSWCGPKRKCAAHIYPMHVNVVKMCFFSPPLIASIQFLIQCMLSQGFVILLATNFIR